MAPLLNAQATVSPESPCCSDIFDLHRSMSPTTSDIIMVTLPSHLQKKSSVHWVDFCGLKVEDGQKSFRNYQHSTVTVLPQQKMHKWIDMLKKWQSSCHWQGMAAEGNIQQVCMLILGSRRVTIDEGTRQLQISHGSTYVITHHGHHFCVVTCWLWWNIDPQLQAWEQALEHGMETLSVSF
jgi:hypothetical protein